MKLTGRRTWSLIAGVAVVLAITTAASAATAGTGHTAPRTIPKCTASDLGVWVAADEGNGTTGSIYYPLEFTNVSSQTCYMYGFPGVSTTNSVGRQLGSPATWNRVVNPAIVNLAPGATAHSILQYVIVAVSPQCKQAQASLIKVYPPDQTSSATGFWDFESCTTAKPVYLYVEAIQPGPGPRI
jgi:hypothetical protein